MNTLPFPKGGLSPLIPPILLAFPSFPESSQASSQVSLSTCLHLVSAHVTDHTAFPFATSARNDQRLPRSLPLGQVLKPFPGVSGSLIALQQCLLMAPPFSGSHLWVPAAPQHCKWAGAVSAMARPPSPPMVNSTSEFCSCFRQVRQHSWLWSSCSA